MDDDKANRRSTSKGKQTARENPVLALIGSAAVALVIGLFISAFQIAGVISMRMAHLLMFLAGFVSVISVWFLGSYGYVVRTRLIAIAILVVFLVGSDRLMVKLRAENDRATAPRGSLQWRKVEIPAVYSLIEIGKRFGVSWYFANPGPERIFNVVPFYKAYVEEVNEQTSERVKMLVERDRQSFPRKPNGFNLGLGEGTWTTIPSSPLTRQQYEGILVGTTRIYFVARIVWEDAQGYEDAPLYRCVWLQADSYFSARRVEDIVWHFC